MNVRPINREKQRELGIVLKALFDCVAAEPVPKSIHDTLAKLDAKHS
jgi:hypothetical protein